MRGRTPVQEDPDRLVAAGLVLFDLGQNVVGIQQAVDGVAHHHVHQQLRRRGNGIGGQLDFPGVGGQGQLLADQVNHEPGARGGQRAAQLGIGAGLAYDGAQHLDHHLGSLALSVEGQQKAKPLFKRVVALFRQQRAEQPLADPGQTGAKQLFSAAVQRI